MRNQKIDKAALCKTAQLIAKALGTRCPVSSDCTSCDHDCMAMEIAQQVLASGYDCTNKRAKKSTMQCKTMTAFVEELSKTIAIARGYGCNDQDSCTKCSCARTVGCVPFDIAQRLIEYGYRKGKTE